MVLLTLTPAAKAAVEEYFRLSTSVEGKDHEAVERLDGLREVEVGSQVRHSDLIDISSSLVKQSRQQHGNTTAKEWRLDTLLKGASVYQPPPPPKPEPTPEYKALMRQLRKEEEQRQYERMINPPPPQEMFSRRFPNVPTSFNPATSIGQGPGADEVDEVTYADVNRQMALIINVLVSIIACSVAIWMAARRWEVPQRLGLSMSGSGLVALAEVAIYMGYIKRIKDAKATEVKKVETKEIVETWVSDRATSSAKSMPDDTTRYRKGKHR